MVVDACRAAKTTVGAALFLAVACALEARYHEEHIAQHGHMERKDYLQKHAELDREEVQSAMFGIMTVDTRHVLRQMQPQLSDDVIGTCMGSQFSYGQKFTIPELHKINQAPNPRTQFWLDAKRVRDEASRAINSGEILTIGYFATWRGGVQMEFNDGTSTLKDRKPPAFAFGVSNVGNLDSDHQESARPGDTKKGSNKLRDDKARLPGLFTPEETRKLGPHQIIDIDGTISRGPQATQWFTCMTFDGKLRLGTSFGAEIFKREEEALLLKNIKDLLVSMSKTN